jgi:hypothetical protein
MLWLEEVVRRKARQDGEERRPVQKTASEHATFGLYVVRRNVRDF